ncbi:MAG: tetratricopeptide repeat protein [Methanomassiliicoccaceae archaeon]|nr:tetratricopeptide repeat protein [Methanomassiliicoccaceae archaeon]
MTDVLLKRIAAWLSEYAAEKISGSLLSVFGREVRRPNTGTIASGDIMPVLSGLEISAGAEKVFLSGMNRKLICACIFYKDIGPSRHVDPSDMENVKDAGEEKVRNEIKDLILTVHEKIWRLSAVSEKMGRLEVQRNIRADLEDVVRELKAIRERGAPAEEEEEDTRGPVATSYPRPSPAFAGREMDILRLLLLLEKSNTVFVCGPAGIGKSELCGKFAEGWASVSDDGERKRTAVWLSCDGGLRSAIAWRLKVRGIKENETMDENRLFASKLAALSADPMTLLVIDNFCGDDDGSLNTVSGCGFRKIFITRNNEFLSSYNGVEIGALPDGTALDLLFELLGDERKEWAEERKNELRELLRRIGCHTLSIKLIADIIRMNGTEPPELLSIVSRADMTRQEEKDIANVLGLLGAVTPESREADILKMISMLPVSGMPLEKFIEFAELDDNDMIILRSLERRGWVSITEIDGSGDRIIHSDPMIMNILRSDHGPKDDDCCVFFNSLEKFFDLGRSYGNWEEKMNMLPVLISATDSASTSPYAPILYSLAGRYLRGSGDADGALIYYMRALDDKEKRFGADHPCAAPTYTGIGNVYSDKGEYDKAVEYYIKALKVSGRLSGINDPSIAMTYNNVGIAYSEKGDHDKALEYYGKALEIRERVLGEEHQDTAATYSCMGNAYSDKGEYDKALEYYGKALEIREKVLGPDHYYTAVTHGNIGVAHLRMENYAKALESTVKAAEIMRRTVGAEHPDTAAAYEVIAHIRNLTGDGDAYAEYKITVIEDWNFMYR